MSGATRFTPWFRDTKSSGASPALVRRSPALRRENAAGVGVFVGACGRCPNRKAGQKHSAPFISSPPTTAPNLRQNSHLRWLFFRRSSSSKYRAAHPRKSSPAQRRSLALCRHRRLSPLRRYNAGPGKRVGVVGLGGLGHMAVKLASAMGAEVTVFSTSKAKEKDTQSLGARHFVVTRNPNDLKPLANQLDLIIDAVSAPHDIDLYLELLGREGVLALVGLPDKPIEVSAFNLITNGRALAGSMIGNIEQSAEMLDFCGQHNLAAEIELIPIQQVNQAYERTVRGDVRYRFVIDMKSL